MLVFFSYRGTECLQKLHYFYKLTFIVFFVHFVPFSFNTAYVKRVIESSVMMSPCSVLLLPSFALVCCSESGEMHTV